MKYIKAEEHLRNSNDLDHFRPSITDVNQKILVIIIAPISSRLIGLKSEKKVKK